MRFRNRRCPRGNVTLLSFCGQAFEVENSQVGPFRVLKKLGSQRRHQVYHAQQSEQGREVALKFLQLPEGVPQELVLAKIHHEVQVLKRLDHPNLVKVFGAGVHEDRIFLASELVPGESLAALLTRRGRIAPDLAIDYGTQLAAALEYLHQDDLIHGNLTTDKVLIDPDNNLKITDVRLNRPHKRRWDAAKRANLETAAYLAPEQLLGEGVTHKSDLYSLGVLLYEMVTGKLPFDPRTMGQLARDKKANRAKKVSEHVLNCPVWLDKLIMKMIRTDPKQRPHSARAVILTLEQIREVDQNRQSVAVEMTRGFSALTAGRDRTEAQKLLGKQPLDDSRRHPLTRSWPFLAGALFLTLVIGSLIAYWPFSRDPTDLMSQASTLMLSSDPEDWRRARKIYERLGNSSDAGVAEEATNGYYLARRKAMLFRLDRALSGLEKPEVKEFNRGYQLQKQRMPEEALAFFEYFVTNYDREQRLPYVYDEALARLEGLRLDKQESVDALQLIQEQLGKAQALAEDPLSLMNAHKIWRDIMQDYGHNDFLQLQLQEAESGILTHPLPTRPISDEPAGIGSSGSQQTREQAGTDAPEPLPDPPGKRSENSGAVGNQDSPSN